MKTLKQTQPLSSLFQWFKHSSPVLAIRETVSHLIKCAERESIWHTRDRAPQATSHRSACTLKCCAEEKFASPLSFSTAPRGSAKKRSVAAFTTCYSLPEFTWSKNPVAARVSMPDLAALKKARLRFLQRTEICRAEWETAMRISPILLSWQLPQFKGLSAVRRICRSMLFSRHEAWCNRVRGLRALSSKSSEVRPTPRT